LFRLAVEALTSFSDVPLNLAAYLGTFTAFASGLAAFIVLILSLAGVLSTSVGTWVLIAVLFLGGLQLLSAGILGRYLARVHEEALGRPLFVVERVLSMDSPAE
jgi:dolichol-phosphate mannosyltransferase